MSANEDKKQMGDEQAADMVRQRIEALYDEIEDETRGMTQSSLVDVFWQRHHASPDPHKAWLHYYNSLSEKDRHRLWEDYHLQLASANKTPVASPQELQEHTVAAAKTRRSKRFAKYEERGPLVSFLRNHIWPLASAALIVSMVWLVFNNELIIARVQQFVSPSNSDISPTIIDPSVSVGSEPRVIIPKINVDVPVVYDVAGYDEADIQNGLERGVVHYGSTALPGERGNNVIVGHSSNNFFNSGRYKFAFVLLNRLEKGDTFYLHYNSKRYVYKVTVKAVIEPDDFTYIQPTDVPTATLITCDPPGTSWRRLIIQGEQISPDPDSAKEIKTEEIAPDTGEVIPGNAPSLWDRLWGAIF